MNPSPSIRSDAADESHADVPIFVRRSLQDRFGHGPGRPNVDIEECTGRRTAIALAPLEEVE